MKIIWDITSNDIRRISDFVAKHQNAFVAYRTNKNINRQNIRIDKDSILKSLIMCLLTSQQRSGPNSPIGVFLRQQPFPLIEETISIERNLETFLQKTLKQHGLNRFINKIPKYFATNYERLQKNNWNILNDIECLNGNSTKENERIIADNLQDLFDGFGPKQSRNFLQALGVTKYEIPLDSRITNWLNDFGFPITLKSKALQDKGYYHFVSDGIQFLCDKASVYPCVFDAAVFSSFDKNEWTEGNSIY